MPYTQFKRDGKYCIRNIKTGKTTCFKSQEDRATGIRVREAFAHGWKPKKRYSQVHSHKRSGRHVRSHIRKNG